jgi:hypothetical protein
LVAGRRHLDGPQTDVRCHEKQPAAKHSVTRPTKEDIMGRGILLFLLGVPLPIILLLALFWH